MRRNTSGNSLYLQLLAVTAVYAIAAIGGLAYAVVGSSVTLIWAPSGIALAALLVFGYRMAWGVALGAFLANAWTGIPLLAAAGIACGNTLEALIGAFLLLRMAHFHRELDRRRDVLALVVLGATLNTLVSALAGVATLRLSGLIDMEQTAEVILTWWLGDMLGILVVAPPLLLSLSASRASLSPLKIAEAIGLVTVLAGVSYATFGAPGAALQGYYPASLAVFPFIIWGALRFGQWGASLVTLFVSVLAIWGTSQGTGPFATGEPVDSLVRWCAFAIVVAVTGLLLAASVAEQLRAQSELKKSHDELERRVDERTRDLTCINADLRREMTARRQLQSRLIRISEDQLQAFGRELHDGLCQQLTSLGLFGAALQQQLAQRGQPEAQTAQRIVDLAHQTSAMARAMAHDLYPADLALGGLTDALTQLAIHTHSLPAMSCAFHADPGVQVNDPLAAINLYRIAQEAIGNAVKYSQAGQLHINLTRVSGATQLSISDDGIGIDLAQVQQRGVGMLSMGYRASLLDGTLEVLKNTPSGTRIVALFPDQGS